MSSAIAAETADQTAPLDKVDSAISGLSSSPTEEKKMGHRRTSSSVPGVYNVNDLGMDIILWQSPIQTSSCRRTAVEKEEADARTEKEGKELEIAKETQKLNWYVDLTSLWNRCATSLA